MASETSADGTGAKLLVLADLDRQILQLDKQNAELPQRQKLQELQRQKQTVQSNAQQLEDMRVKFDRKFKALRDSKDLLSGKIAGIQESITAGGADYRELANLTKELQGYSNQVDDLSEKQRAFEEQEFKVAELQEQAEKSLAQLEAREAALTSSLNDECATLIAQKQEMTEERQRVIALLDAGLVERYEQTRASKAGVGAVALRERICGGCHMELSEGQISQSKEAGEIGECPFCHRLLVNS